MLAPAVWAWLPSGYSLALWSGAAANATRCRAGGWIWFRPYGILGSRAGSGLRPNPVTCVPGGSWGRLRRVVKPPGLDVAAFAFGLGRAILAGGGPTPFAAVGVVACGGLGVPARGVL